MIAMKRGWMLVSVLLALLGGCAECAVAQAPLAVTTVQDTVYTASGAAASGTVLVSWPGFTTASGAVIPAGTTSVTIGTSGLLSVALAPNAGATPIGSYYTATFHLGDGSTSREYWVIPVAVAGGPPVKLAQIQNDVLPTSVAMQTVSKTYVDMAIAAAVTGYPADSSTPYVLKSGDTMTGPLVVPAITAGTLNATTITGSVDGAAIATGTVSAARLPVVGPSGSGHAPGIVPDPGATAGATRYLREDGTWDAPPAGGTGTMAGQNASAVAITGGTIAPTVATLCTAGTWTPVDASSAALTFTSAQGRYTQCGKLVTFWFNVTYPTTTSTAFSYVGGLPVASQNLPGWGIQGSVTYVSSGSTIINFSGPQTTAGTTNNDFNFSTNSNTNVLNVTLSGSAVIGFGTYITN